MIKKENTNTHTKTRNQSDTGYQDGLDRNNKVGIERYQLLLLSDEYLWKRIRNDTELIQNKYREYLRYHKVKMNL